MLGAGFAKDMIAQAESNRSTLRGIGSHIYRNFDTAYITDAIISRKVPVYQEAKPEYLKAIRERLIKEEGRLNFWRAIVLVISTGIIAGGVYFLFQVI